MKNETSNRVNMIRTTLLFCTNNPTPTAGIPAFAITKTAADNKLVLIDSFTQIAEGGTGGVTTDTNSLRLAMSNIALKCGSAVSAYAASINNNTLRDAVTFTSTDLNRMKKDEVDDACQTIRDEANTHIATAGAFGYVAADVTDLQTAITLYRNSAQNPRQARISISVAVANRETLVREIIEDLFKKLMDKMVSTLKATQPDFVQGYFLAREIIDLGSTFTKVRGTVKTVEDVPLANVLFTIFATGTSTIAKQVITNAEGKYSATQLSPGDYDFKWELAGYVTITETNVHVSAGKEVKRDKTMVVAENILATQQGVVGVGMRVNLGAPPAGTTKVRMKVLAGGPLEFGMSADGLNFNGNTTTMGAGAETTYLIADFASTGTTFVVFNQNGSAQGEYRVEFIG